MTTRATKTNPAATLMLVRTWHTYIGMLIAPTVLFFACTGILQIYHLDVARLGYTPPAIFEKLGQVHKNQVYAPRRRRPPPSPA